MATPHSRTPFTPQPPTRSSTASASAASSLQASAQWPRSAPWCYSQPTPQQTPQQASPSPSSPNDHRSPRRNTTMASLPTLSEGIALTHFIVAEDVERAARFYSDVLGGEIVLAGEPTIVALANSWIIINVGGGPTDDKPSVILEPPQNPDRESSFLNIRVADIQTIYQTWSERGAHFLTPPIDRGPETRCYLRDPDGHLIELGQMNRTVNSTD